MVLSKIDSSINYQESKTIYSDDLNFETHIYKGEIYNKKIEFVLGKPNFEYIDNDLVYFNIYLVSDNKTISRIGLFEIKNSIYTNSLDEEGEIIVSKLNNPLIFSFSKVLINSYKEKNIDSDFEEDIDTEPDDEDESTSDDDSSQDIESDLDISDFKKEEDLEKIETDKIINLTEQTKEESDLEMKNYERTDDKLWINNYMKSSKYSIKDNEGGGDCFFAVIRDGLKTVKINTSVTAIREKLSNEVTEEVLENYKLFFSIYYGGLKKSRAELMNNKKKHKMLKTMIGGTNEGPEKSKLIQEAKENFSSLSKNSQESQEFQELVKEMEWMKDIDTVDQLKSVIKTKQFWADSWAVSVLERLYNLKFIILSKNHFEGNEIENVLQCGDGDKQLLDKGIYEPSWYIISDYEMGVHYKLITYDKNINRGAFKFNELPYRIKELVLQKCMEKKAGLFNIIPDFIDFAKLNNQKIRDSKTMSDTKELDISKKIADVNNDVIIQIYNKSKHDKVGLGSGETIKPDMKTLPNILELNDKKKSLDWRKKLDNDYLVKNLNIDGNEWSSVKHYLLAYRFNKLPEIYSKFMKDGEFGSNLENANSYFKSEKVKKANKSLIITDEEYLKEEDKLIEKALYNKFNQNEELLNILKLTKNYLINIYRPKLGIIPAIQLMKIRSLLNKN